MRYDGRGREGTQSIHQAALDNLRRGSKPVLIFFGAVLGLMALFVGGSFLFVQQNMPSPPTAVNGTSTGSSSPSAGGPAVWRSRLTAFLDDAARGRGDAWFPGAAGVVDGLTYTPLSSRDPGANRPDGLAHVPYRDISAADRTAVLTAVSRGGAVQPSSLAVSKSTGTDQSWTVNFVVKTRAANGDAWLEGRAEGYTKPDGATVILRLVYPSANTASHG
ncbi:hypothetical protein [Streptomyces sp. TP-A0356]|uniref:hypothetical protein n=1 Tax=Streptomyces sp. TP-A0356 TaxID=1359208 RepID=UPI0006E3E353|nr:hypothetical protein [Streptomyces sp. TP-A0356]